MDYLMSKQLSDGVCEKCFSFGGVTSRPDPAIKDSTTPISFPICKSTLHPLLGYYTHKPPTLISPASQKSRPQSRSKSPKPQKIMVSLGNIQVEQAHFNDYLKQLKSEKKGKGKIDG